MFGLTPRDSRVTNTSIGATSTTSKFVTDEFQVKTLTATDINASGSLEAGTANIVGNTAVGGALAIAGNTAVGGALVVTGSAQVAETLTSGRVTCVNQLLAGSATFSGPLSASTVSASGFAGTTASITTVNSVATTTDTFNGTTATLTNLSVTSVPANSFLGTDASKNIVGVPAPVIGQTFGFTDVPMTANGGTVLGTMRLYATVTGNVACLVTSQVSFVVPTPANNIVLFTIPWSAAFPKYASGFTTTPYTPISVASSFGGTKSFSAYLNMSGTGLVTISALNDSTPIYIQGQTCTLNATYVTYPV